MRNRYVTEFHSKQHLRECLSASICVPGVFAFSPTNVGNKYCIDSMIHERNFKCCESSIPIRPFTFPYPIEYVTGMEKHMADGIVGPYHPVSIFNPVICHQSVADRGYNDAAQWLAKHHKLVKNILEHKAYVPGMEKHVAI
eukprot:Pgem_evm1s14267